MIHTTLVHICLSSLCHLLMKPLWILSLTLLTINLFYPITNSRSLKAFNMNRRRSLWYVFGIWYFPVLVTVLAIIGIEISSETNVTKICDLLVTTPGKVKGFIFAVNFVCLVTSFYNIWMWLFIRNHNRRVADQNVLPNDVVKARIV